MFCCGGCIVDYVSIMCVMVKLVEYVCVGCWYVDYYIWFVDELLSCVFCCLIGVC